MLGRLIIALTTLIFLAACQTSMVRSFDSIHAGMDKSQVLDLVGPPDASTRLHGKDRWIWSFYEQGIRFEKEVHFADGTVIYSGNTWEPPAEKSAEAVDQKTAQVEQKLQTEEKAREQAKKNNADLYREYEKAAHNDGKKVKYLPKFVDLK